MVSLARSKLSKRLSTAEVQSWLSCLKHIHHEAVVRHHKAPFVVSNVVQRNHERELRTFTGGADLPPHLLTPLTTQQWTRTLGPNFLYPSYFMLWKESWTD